MSDALLQSAFIYQEISKYEYYFIFGDKKRNLYYIPIKLKNENYPHLIGVCGKINLHTIAAQKYITPQAA